MKNLLTAAFVCLLFAGTANSQSFPILHAQNLQDKDVTLPDYVKGKRAVICMAFSMKADESLKKWTQPLYNHLLADGMGGLMGTNMYNANLCFVAMLRGIAKMGMGELKSRSKKSVDAKLHPWFLISDDDADALMQQLKITEKNEPHFFVVDEKGTILFQTWGAYTDKKMDSITDALLK